MSQVPQKNRQAWLRRITESPRIAVPRFEPLDVVVDRSGHPHLEGRSTNWRQRGFIRMRGLQRLHASTDRPAVVVAGSRFSRCPSVAGRAGVFLASSNHQGTSTSVGQGTKSEGSQVLLTTHSPDLLADEGVGLDEVLELELTPDGTIGRLLSVIPGIVQDWQDGISLSDIMRARSAPPGIERLSSVDLAAG